MKGTAGIVLLNSVLPKDVQLPTDREIGKREFMHTMRRFAEKHPQLYKERVHEIVALAEKMAYHLGSNVGMRDLAYNEKLLDRTIRSVEQRIKKAKSDDEKRKILIRAFDKAIKDLEKYVPSDNEMLQQVQSSSRGKPAQLARMAVSPFYAVGMDERPKPVMIKNNFIKGLKPSEYFHVASQGRLASVKTANATAEPGEFGKVLVANADDMVITMRDCGTKNGICMDPKDHHIVGRYEAGTNKLIDEAYWKRLKNSGKSCVRVRSPITCEAPRGVCAMCYGLKPNGKLPDIGDEVGIIAAQSIGEPLTQMVLSTKHSVKAKDDDSGLTGMKGFKTIVNSPDKFAGKASVSPVSGRVIRIDKAPQGGHYVYIGSDKNKVYVDDSVVLAVKQGDFVYKGQALSSGLVTVKDVMKHLGVGAARKHEADLLHRTFLDSAGRDLDKRHFEIVARGHLDVGKTEDGELTGVNAMLKNYPHYKKKVLLTPDVIGKYLGDNVDIFIKGTLIDDYIYELMKRKGVRNIYVTDQKPPVKPVYKTLVMRPNFGRNLFGRLNYRYLKKALADEIKFGKGFEDKDIISGRERHTAHR